MIGTTTNDYWEAVREHVVTDNVFGTPTPVIDAYGSIRRDYNIKVNRNELCSRYSWTVTDPATVEFVRDYAGPMLVDPLAGSGWWAHLLGEDHVDVLASDLNPPDGTDANHWHRSEAHVPILRLDAEVAVKRAGALRTLLLSWPPYDSSIGSDILTAYRGNRVIYIGEGWGGCCGDDDLFAAFENDWDEVASHRPIQFFGIRDWITVYERKDGIR